MTTRWPDLLPSHDRFDYRPITRRPDYAWPNGARLAVYLGFNIEHFAFGDGLGACIGPASPQPDVLNHGWREYGNRVGAWRCLELFDALALPTGALINTALYDHCPELVQACVARGDELIGHGHSNAERQGALDEAHERALLLRCRERMLRESGQAPAGWLSPWISESAATPDLLAETGYGYTLNWCHDDQPVRMRTRGGGSIWSVPYPQELNDIPMIVGRLMDAEGLQRDDRRQLRRNARPVARTAAGDGACAASVHRGPAVPAAPSANGAGAPGECTRPGRDLDHHAGRDRNAHAAACGGSTGGLRLSERREPRTARQISIFEPNSTTALFGSPRNAAAPLALWCSCANSFSRHGAMPLPSVGMTTSRERK
jgi:allantoinase